MKKVNKEMKLQIKYMTKKGMSQVKIGKVFGLSQSTIGYHASKTQKANTINRVMNNKYVWKGRKAYMKKYMSERYNSDPEFKSRVQKDNRENQRRKNAKE